MSAALHEVTGGRARVAPNPAESGFLDALRVGMRASMAHRWLTAAFFAATIVQGAVQGALVWALRAVLLHLGGGASGRAGDGAVATAAATILGVWALRAAANCCAELLSNRLAHRVEMDGMRRMLAKLLTLPVRFFERTSQGDLIIAAYHDMRGVRTVTLHLASILGAAARLVGLGVVVVLMSPKLAAIGLVMVPLGALPASLAGRRITNAARDERRVVSTFHDSFMQVVQGIRVIKVNRGEGRVLDRAARVGEELFEHLVGQARARSYAGFLMEAVSGVGLIAVLVVGGRDVASGELPWQSLMSLLVAMMAVYAPLTTLLQVYSSVRSVMPNLERMREIMDAAPEIADVPDARRLLQAPATIQLEDVWFGYGEAAVLRGLSATFYRGETIGIVGPSGSGKSTLLSLLLRLYDPTAGRVMFDGVDLRHIRHADVMELSAIVLQEPFLFLDTIANNIRIARPDATPEQVVAAAVAANVHDEISVTRAGYDTVVGRRHDARGVSVGQKQRISIASALLKNAPILFLDEATSNLDSVSERVVQDAIDRLMRGRTTFIIAHRLSTLRGVDRILVLDGGEIVGLAPHDELLATCATYGRLWESQNGDQTGAPGAAAYPGAAARRPHPQPTG